VRFYRLISINAEKRHIENTAVFKTDVKQVFDFIRCSKDKNKLLELVENDVYYSQVDDDAYDVITKYANAKELVKKEEYKSEGGKNNMCKAIQDLMNDSREEGREEGRELGRELGREEGYELGIKRERIRAIQKKLDKQKSLEQIADELEIKVSDVKVYIQLIQEKENKHNV